MTLKQSTYLNGVLGALCFALIIFTLIPSSGSGSKKILFNLKDAAVEIDVVNDRVDTNIVLTKLLNEQSLATIGILNGHDFYEKSDTSLITALEKENNTNPLVTKLRTDAANSTSIFSNNLLSVTLKVAPRFSPTSLKIGSCNKSEYFNKFVLLSSIDETAFTVVKVTESGGCSTDINQLYINSNISNFLSGCSASKSTIMAKAQIYEDANFINEESELCENNVL